MNFREAMQPGMTSMEYLDIPHDEKYEMIVNSIGYEDVKRCIPFSLDVLKKAYAEDKNFNNLGIGTWDLAAGFKQAAQGRCILVRSRLTNLYWEKCKVNTFSCSDGVCILKCCARMWVEEEKDGTE